VCAEASIVSRAVAADFFLNFGVWRSLLITYSAHTKVLSTIMPKAFVWKRSRISMLKVEAILQSFIP
jgi:hypothetical protein